MDKRQRTLRVVFLKYLFISFVTVGIAAILPFFVYNIILNTDILLPANYVENQINREMERLSNAPKIEKNIIPDGAFYMILSKDYAPKEGDLKKKFIEEAILYAKGEIELKGSKKSYKLIRRDNEYLILQYFVQPRYSNSKLNRYLPNPDTMLITIIVVNVMFFSIIISVLFAKDLKEELRPLFSATDKIKQKDLEFSVGHSKIKEFNDALDSIEDMKTELKKSLEEQWSLEQSKNEQISMLGHDIKTPLTIIRGNSELLKELNEDGEKDEYIEYILEGTKDIETYIKILLDITKTENKMNVKFEKIETSKLVVELQDKLKALANHKELKIIFNQRNLPDYIIADASLLKRGIINVLSNAVDYSKKGGEVQFIVEGTRESIRFIVIDNGEGFTKEDIENAYKKFYIGDKSRSLKGHYGMGLYITDMITKLHNGKLILGNRYDDKIGAKVIIEVPLNSENKSRKHH